MALDYLLSIVEIHPLPFTPLKLSTLLPSVVQWLVPRDFRYRGSIKDAVSLKLGEREAER